MKKGVMNGFHKCSLYITIYIISSVVTAEIRRDQQKMNTTRHTRNFRHEAIVHGDYSVASLSDEMVTEYIVEIESINNGTFLEEGPAYPMPAYSYDNNYCFIYGEDHIRVMLPPNVSLINELKDDPSIQGLPSLLCHSNILEIVPSRALIELNNLFGTWDTRFDYSARSIYSPDDYYPVSSDGIFLDWKFMEMIKNKTNNCSFRTIVTNIRRINRILSSTSHAIRYILLPDNVTIDKGDEQDMWSNIDDNFNLDEFWSFAPSIEQSSTVPPSLAYSDMGSSYSSPFFSIPDDINIIYLPSGLVRDIMKEFKVKQTRTKNPYYFSNSSINWNFFYKLDASDIVYDKVEKDYSTRNPCNSTSTDSTSTDNSGTANWEPPSDQSWDISWFLIFCIGISGAVCCVGVLKKPPEREAVAQGIQVEATSQPQRQERRLLTTEQFELLPTIKYQYAGSYRYMTTESDRVLHVPTIDLKSNKITLDQGQGMTKKATTLSCFEDFTDTLLPPPVKSNFNDELHTCVDTNCDIEKKEVLEATEVVSNNEFIPKEQSNGSENYDKGSRHDACAICIEEFELNETVIVLPRCLHKYHVVCIKQWLTEQQPTCPTCKAEVLKPNS